MKMKNIGFFEANFEKFLLGLALLVVAVSTYYFVFSTPNEIELNNQPAQPSEVDNVVYSEAQRLQAQLSSELVADPLKNLKVPDYTANFVGKLGQAATPVSEFTIPMGGLAFKSDKIIDDPGGAPKPFFEPAIPTPTIVAQAADMGAINEAEVDAIPELKTALGDGPPYDTAWVSVVGQFSMADMVKQLTQAEDDRHRMIPPDWWKTTFAIVDVQLARQQQNPDGTWPADDKYELVATLPGKLSFRGVPRDPTPQQASEYLKLINQHRGVVIQQPFYELANDRVWVAPEPVDETVEVAAGDVKEQVRELERQMRLKLARVRIIEQQITRLKSPRSTNRPTPGGGRPGGFEGLEGVSGEFGEFGPSAPTAPRSTGGSSILEKRVQRLTDQANQIKLELKELQDQYKKLTTGEDTPAGRRPATPARRPGATPYPGEFGGEFGEFGPEFGGEFGEFGPGAPAPRRDDAALNILGTETVDLWASDLGVEPGKTYRYRMRVTVVNVLFRKPGLPEAQQKANENKFLVDSAWSDWGKPVAIEKVQHFFVMSASPQPEPGQATFENWKFYNGQWYRAEFSVHPGDPIGGKAMAADPTGQKVEVDFATGGYLVDIDFNYIVRARLGNLPRKTQVVMYIMDGQLMQRRVDLDKDDPMRRQLQDKMRSGIAAGPGAFTR
jgi:hypothetical protein